MRDATYPRIGAKNYEEESVAGCLNRFFRFLECPAEVCWKIKVRRD